MRPFHECGRDYRRAAAALKGMLTGLWQRLGANAPMGAIVLIFASALIWVAVAFAGYALYLAFLPQSGAPMAAAIASAILIAGPLGAAVIVLFGPPQRTRKPFQIPAEHIRSPSAEDTTLRLLAKVAEEKPLLAVMFAGILGVADAITRRKHER